MAHIDWTLNDNSLLTDAHTLVVIARNLGEDEIKASWRAFTEAQPRALPLA